MSVFYHISKKVFPSIGIGIVRRHSEVLVLVLFESIGLTIGFTMDFSNTSGISCSSKVFLSTFAKIVGIVLHFFNKFAGT